MAETFLLPAVGDTMVEGEIVEWFVSVGDTVELDQTICSIETDKSVVEMTTPYRGTVLQLGGGPGEVVEVGAPLIIVGEPNEHVAPVGGASPPDPPIPLGPPDASRGSSVGPNVDPISAANSDSGRIVSPVLRKLAMANDVDVDLLVGTGPGGRISRDDIEAAGLTAQSNGPNGRLLAMPKVRKFARNQGIDLHERVGSGPSGSVTLADLSDAAAAAQSSGDRRERMPAIRRSIAKHLTQSAQQIPQFTSMVEVDATAVLATRAALRERLEVPVPIDALLMALMIPVLRDHPIANAALDGDEIVYYSRYDIGLAVDTPNGLMLPVVRNADQCSIEEVCTDIVRLASAARERTIRPEQLSGATCTINNVGSLGVLAGTPILPLGTSTIVAFGMARPVLQLRTGNVVEVPTMTLSATFDHRLIDGGHSGRFLKQLKEHLEVPALGLLC